ncbi:zinc finger protein 2-like isoform X2 [Trichoplusia ni]|nr:zinc finger protein 2-like isoform X2 [Trichoplusia ni]
MTTIRSLTNISIEDNDFLPKYICTNCVETLELILKFKRTCEASDKKFRKILLPAGNSTSSYPNSKHDMQHILNIIKQKRIKQEEKAEQKKVKHIEKEEKPLQKKTPKTKQFKCPPCDLTFTNQEKLMSHRRERRCVRRACDICGQLVLSIAQHMRHVHKEVMPHKCPTCGKEFPVIARLKNHMLVHTDTFNFFCDLCPYKCKHKNYLVLHMRTHTGEKPYMCAQCPATFVNLSNLNKHKLTHQEKQFKCMLCEKTFRTNTALREHHEAAHMNIKHTCNHCGREFCYKSDLRKHERRNHNRVKRDSIGCEPTYKLLERKKIQEKEAIDKWRDQELTTTEAVPVTPTSLDHPKEPATNDVKLLYMNFNEHHGTP